MRLPHRLGFLVLIFAALIPAPAQDLAAYSKNVAALIDPAKLATLAKRGANPRIQKVVAQLEDARRSGFAVSLVTSNAVTQAGYTNQHLFILTYTTLVRNHGIAEKLGVFDVEGMKEMGRGQSPTIRKGPYRNDQLTVDHIIPVAVAPELDNLIANLELMPGRMNSGKRDRMGARQYELAKQFRLAGVLTAERLEAILNR